MRSLGSIHNLNGIVFVKTILMILVILGHSCAFWSEHWFTENPLLHSASLDTLYTWINSFHVYSFTLASGYLFAFKTKRGGYPKYSSFLVNKASRLLIPYFFTAIIWVAPISAYFFNWNLGYVVKKYLLAIDLSQLWFLWMLFDIFAIIWPIKKVIIEKPAVGWGLAIILYGIGIAGKRVFPNIFCIWTACQFVPFFYIGMRIQVKEECEEKLITESVPWLLWVVVDLVVFAGTVRVRELSGNVWSVIAIGCNLLLHVIGAIMAWVSLQALASRINWRSSQAVKTLSSYTMPMYLFHQQIIYFTITWLNGKVEPWLNAGVNFIAALIGSFLISSVLMRWRVTRLLIGEK